MIRGTASVAASLLRRAATAATCSSEVARLAASSAKKPSATSTNASSIVALLPRRGAAFSSLSGPCFAASRSLTVATKPASQSRSFVAAALATAARLRGTANSMTSTSSSTTSLFATTRPPRHRLFSTSSLPPHPHPASPLLGPEAGIACGLSLASSRSLSKWLAFCAAWTFSMVVLGGVTRLTRSGLSMTSWSFAGERPPMSSEGWELEFEEYKRHPVSSLRVGWLGF